MMQESKLTNFQQRHLEKTLRGECIDLYEYDLHERYSLKQKKCINLEGELEMFVDFFLSSHIFCNQLAP